MEIREQAAAMQGIIDSVIESLLDMKEAFEPIDNGGPEPVVAVSQDTIRGALILLTTMAVFTDMRNHPYTEVAMTMTGNAIISGLLQDENTRELFQSIAGHLSTLVDPEWLAEQEGAA